MRLFVAITFFVLSSSVYSEVIYLKRSEAFGYILGQQAGQAVGQTMELRQYTAQRQAGYAKLESLRKDQKACSSCANIKALTAQIDDLEGKLFYEDGLMCGTFDSVSDFNPAIGAIQKLTGYDNICSEYYKARSIGITESRHTSNKAEFVSRIRTGDKTAYAWMGRRTMITFRSLPVQEQMGLACPYYLDGSRKGDSLSITLLMQECVSLTKSVPEQRELFAILKACADRGELGCSDTIGTYYETTRRTNTSWPNDADDTQALKYYKMNMAYWEKVKDSRPGDASVLKALAGVKASVDRVALRISGSSNPSSATPAVPSAASAPNSPGADQSITTAPAPLSPPVFAPSTPNLAAQPNAAVRAVPSRSAVRQKPTDASSDDSSGRAVVETNESARAPLGRTEYQSMRREVNHRNRCEAILKSLNRVRESALRNPLQYGSRLTKAESDFQDSCPQ